MAASQLCFVRFPRQCGFFSWPWPASPRENHPSPSSDSYLQPTQVISGHSHRFPDVLSVPSLATFFCSTFEIINTALLNGCQSVHWHCGTGPTPPCWSAAHGRTWLCPSPGSTAGWGNAESSHGLGGTELCWMDARCPPCPDPVENQCPCDRHSSLLAHFKPHEHPTDKNEPFATMAKAASPLRPSCKQAVFLQVPLSPKIPCNEESQGWEGSEHGTAQKVCYCFSFFSFLSGGR